MSKYVNFACGTTRSGQCINGSRGGSGAVLTSPVRDSGPIQAYPPIILLAKSPLAASINSIQILRSIRFEGSKNYENKQGAAN